MTNKYFLLGICAEIKFYPINSSILVAKVPCKHGQHNLRSYDGILIRNLYRKHSKYHIGLDRSLLKRNKPCISFCGRWSDFCLIAFFYINLRWEFNVKLTNFSWDIINYNTCKIHLRRKLKPNNKCLIFFPFRNDYFILFKGSG